MHGCMIFVARASVDIDLGDVMLRMRSIKAPWSSRPEVTCLALLGRVCSGRARFQVSGEYGPIGVSLVFCPELI